MADEQNVVDKENNDIDNSASQDANNTAETEASASSINSSCSSLGLLTPLIEFNEILLEEKVGHGSYGVVYKAIWRNRLVAVKEFEASAEQKTIETEVKQLSRVRHENIISLFGISVADKAKYLIMEFAEGGSLHHFLHGKVKPAYATAHAISWARQCAKGVAYLHGIKPKPLIHRDLKPLNLLLTNKGRHLKICDFGTVADKQTLMTNNKGSAAWMAPEVFDSTKYTEKCDVFSWSIVLWEVLTREQPFKDVENPYSIMWKIHKGERPLIRHDFPKPIAVLLNSCWAKIPDVRPNMQYVVSVMDDMFAFFPGAQEPLEYEFRNQQIITPNSNDCVDNYTLDFSTYHLTVNNSAQTQVTPINTSNESSATNSFTPTNENISAQYTMPTASIAASTRWDVIPDETHNSIHLRPPASKVTIHNGFAGVAMAPISVHVDPNAWELNNNGFYEKVAKTDDRERLTVTDGNPIAQHDIAANNTEADEDYEIDGTDQSLEKMLDTELQPEQPIANNVESQAIYREHRRLGKEYLRVDTQLYYAQDFKEKMLIQLDPAERQAKQELLKKMRDKDELLDLYNNLKQQLENLQAKPVIVNRPQTSNAEAPASSNEATELVSGDWVVVSPSHQHT